MGLALKMQSRDVNSPIHCLTAKLIILVTTAGIKGLRSFIEHVPAQIQKTTEIGIEAGSRDESKERKEENF